MLNSDYYFDPDNFGFILPITKGNKNASVTKSWWQKKVFRLWACAWGPGSEALT